MPSKLGFGNSRKKALKKVTMGSPMHFKNPVMMDHAMKFNADLRKASKEGKLNPEFKAVVDAAPTKMYEDKPMKKYVSDAQRRAVHASRADGGAGNPNKMYGKKKK